MINVSCLTIKTADGTRISHKEAVFLMIHSAITSTAIVCQVFIVNSNFFADNEGRYFGIKSAKNKTMIFIHTISLTSKPKKIALITD